MAIKHEAVAIRVSQQILWFGSDAYPLRNITRAYTRTLKPNRDAAIRAYVVSVLAWLVPSIIVASLVPGGLAALIIVGVLALIAVKTIRLVELLKITLHELSIETSAGSHRGLISNDGSVVTDLSYRITDAINNPAAEFQMQVESLHVGDRINMFGDQSVGKVAG